LKNHPDELWEDGVRDYLDHATSIMEKFSDVVNWLKANATKAENSTPGAGIGASFGVKKFLPEVTINENKNFGEKTGSPPVSAATNFATKTENSTTGAGASFAGNKFLPEVTNTQNKIFGEKTGSPPVSSATNFASPWSPGIFIPNQNIFTFGGNNTSGNQSSAPSNSNHNASDDVGAGEDSMLLHLDLPVGLSLSAFSNYFIAYTD
jgi:nuclear pore complex protein Nup50